MAILTAELIEKRLAEHQAWLESLFVPERIHASQSAFEEFAENLGLSPEQWEHSRDLQEWARRRKNFCYVPEELLKAWGMTVEVKL